MSPRALDRAIQIHTHTCADISNAIRYYIYIYIYQSDIPGPLIYLLIPIEPRRGVEHLSSALDNKKVQLLSHYAYKNTHNIQKSSNKEYAIYSQNHSISITLQDRRRR
jgi:hypothetical protein